MVIDRDEIDAIRAELVSKIWQRGKSLVVGTTHHSVDANGQLAFVLVTAKEFHSFAGCFERPFHTADLFVHLANGRVDGDVHSAQTCLHQSLGFFFCNKRAVGGHGHFDAEGGSQLYKIWDLWSQHGLAAGDMDLLRAHFCQLSDDFLEAVRANGRLTRLAPMIAHLAFEVAAIKHFELDIQRLVRARVQDGLFEIFLLIGDGFRTVHNSNIGNCITRVDEKNASERRDSGLVSIGLI